MSRRHLGPCGIVEFQLQGRITRRADAFVAAIVVQLCGEFVAPGVAGSSGRIGALRLVRAGIGGCRWPIVGRRGANGNGPGGRQITVIIDDKSPPRSFLILMVFRRNFFFIRWV